MNGRWDELDGLMVPIGSEPWKPGVQATHIIDGRRPHAILEVRTGPDPLVNVAT